MDSFSKNARVETHITRALIETTIKKKGPFAALGAIFLLLFSLFATQPVLRVYGPWFFIFCCTLVGFGILPYRRFLHLQLHPNSLSWENSYLVYREGKKMLFKIPLSLRFSLHFIQSVRCYGYSLDLSNKNEKIIITCSPQRFKKFMRESQKLSPNKDLFLPYFREKDLFAMQNIED